MRLKPRKQKSAVKPKTKSKTRDTRVVWDDIPVRKNKLSVKIKYPSLDLSRYRPVGDSKKSKAAKRAFDTWPENLVNVSVLLDHLEKVFSEFGLAVNPDSWNYFLWGPLKYDDNWIMAYSPDIPWPYPKEVWGCRDKIIAWKSKREFGVKWESAVVTPQKRESLLQAHERKMERLAVKWKEDVIKERTKSRRSAGFAFPREKKI